MFSNMHRSLSAILGAAVLSAIAATSGNAQSSQLAEATSPKPIVLVESIEISPENKSNNQSVQSGRGTLRVINGTGKDAVAKLIDGASGKTHHTIYVRAYDEVTMRGIPPCNCILKVATGTNWDRSTHRFLSNRAFFQFDERFNFRETSTASGIEWMTYRVTLHPVADGTASTTPISANSF